MDSKQHGDPIVKWYEIQPHLHKCKADVLLLLDCCYSAQAARSCPREDPGKCELLAACAMGLQTPPPGPASFTTALLREMGEMLASSNQIVTSQLAHRLIHHRAQLRQTPVRDDMSLGHGGRAICWKPFNSIEKLHSSCPDTLSHLKVCVAINVDLENQERSLRDLVQWLKIEAPSVVQEVAIDEISLQTEYLQRVIEGQDSSPDQTPLLHALSKAENQNVLEIWRDVQSLLAEGCQSWIPVGEVNSVEKLSQLKDRIRHFAHDLELRNRSVIRRLESTIVKLPDHAFEDVASNTSAEALGLGSPLRLLRVPFRVS